MTCPKTENEDWPFRIKTQTWPHWESCSSQQSYKDEIRRPRNKIDFPFSYFLLETLGFGKKKKKKNNSRKCVNKTLTRSLVIINTETTSFHVFRGKDNFWVPHLTGLTSGPGRAQGGSSGVSGITFSLGEEYVQGKHQPKVLFLQP